MIKRIGNTKGITLISLVVTIIVLIILAGVTISMVLGENGIIGRASETAETTKRENARDKVNVLLGEYQIDKYIDGKTLTEFFEEKLVTGEIDAIIEDNDTEGYIIIEVDGYEFTIDKDTLEIIGDPVKAGGVKPIFEVQVTKVDGTALTSGETEKALTVDITNIGEYGSNYTIEVKDKDGNLVTKETNVVGSLTGQASFIIIQSGSYTIIVTGTKDGITSTTSKVETITVAMATITTQFTKAYGVIDIVWLDTDNNVISSPISPASYLGGLTPVKWTETAGNYTETTTNTSDTDWYSYTAQTSTTETGGTSKWANAKTSDENAYFVWIPRYAYKITYFNNETNKEAYRANSASTTGIVGYSTIDGMIDVTSGRPKLVEGTEPTNVTGTVQAAAYSSYIPHPAFEFDGAKAGIWVGKYQSSGDTTTITIKPNVESLRTIKVSDIFTASQRVKTTYSLTSDSHMMKNTEWGAVAYLTESKYGRNGTEVSINNSVFYTGRSAGEPGSSYTGYLLEGTYTYETAQGGLASTTGNIYGVYDMSGPSYQYVAGYINNSNVSSNGYNTNLLNAVATSSKYADIYKATNDSAENNYEENKGMKGDAVYETSTSYSISNSWHEDRSNFPFVTGPVFLRGR